MSELANAAAEAVVTDTPAPVETPAAEPAPTMEDAMGSVWDKLHQLRDPKGRYATSEPAQGTQESEPAVAETAVEEKTDQPEKTAIEQAGKQSDIEAPPSWSGEMKAKLAALPPEHADLQRYAVERDKAQNEAITRAGQQIKSLEPLTKIVDNYRDSFQRNGVDPHEGIARLLNVEQRFANDPVNTLLEIAASYNIDLQGLAQQAGGETQNEGGEAHGLRQQIASLGAELRDVKSHLTAQQRSQLEGERTALSRRIDEFAQEQKDGKLLRPFFDRVTKDMVRLVDKELAGTDPSAALNKAYDEAIWTNPEIRQEILGAQAKASEQKRAEEASKRATDAKKAAVINQRSSVGSGAAPRTMDDTLDDTASKLYG